MGGSKESPISYMKTVLIHIGQSIPDHIQYSLEQLRVTNPNAPVDMLHNFQIRSEMTELCNKFAINPICIEDFSSTEYGHIEKILNYPRYDFWNVTFRRLYYLRDYLDYSKTTNVLHFDNDIMIYGDLAKIGETSSRLYQRIGMTRGSILDMIFGMSYIKNSEALNPILRFCDSALADGTFQRKHGLCMINEMVVLLQAHLQLGFDFIDLMPSLPYGEQSKYLNEFNSLFDPAAYGQYQAGTPHNNKQPGYTSDDHFIGKELRVGNITMNWYRDGGLKKPCVTDLRTGKNWKLNNMHMHSKIMIPFLSNKGMN